MVSIGADFGLRSLATAEASADFVVLSWVVSLVLAVIAGFAGYPAFFARFGRLRRLADQRQLSGEARWQFLRKHGDASFPAQALVIAGLVAYYFWQTRYWD